MTSFLKEHWDVPVSFGGLVAAISVGKVSLVVELLIAVVTLALVAFRCFVWFLRARIAWRNRDNTEFFEKSKED